VADKDLQNNYYHKYMQQRRRVFINIKETKSYYNFIMILVKK